MRDPRIAATPQTTALVMDQHGGSTWWRITRPFTRLHQRGAPVSMIRSSRYREVDIPRGTELLVMPDWVIGAGDEPNWAAWLTTQRRSYGRKLIIDVDDDVVTPAWDEWMRASAMDQGLDRSVQDIRELRTWMLSMADAVTVPNAQLKQILQPWVKTPIWVVPNAIDVRAYAQANATAYRDADTVLVGWAGGQRPELDLGPMLAAWGRLSRRWESASFVIGGWEPPALYDHVPRERVTVWPWSNPPEHVRGMAVDVGCCAVADTPFNRAKTPIKAWEFAIAGAMVIGTTALYGGTLFDGGRGLVADTFDDWDWCLEMMLRDAKARRAMASRLRRYVTREHSLATNLHRWSTVYRAIADGGRPDERDVPSRAGISTESDAAAENPAVPA